MWCRATSKFEAVSERLGSGSCHMLQLNSGGGSAEERARLDALFKAHKCPAVAGGGAGEPAAHPATPPEVRWIAGFHHCCLAWCLCLQPVSLSCQGLGSNLSASNVKSLSRFVEDFAVRSLLPHMETRLRRLHQQVCCLHLAGRCPLCGQCDVATRALVQVMANRKGVRNQLKNLLWRSKSLAADVPRTAAAAGPAFGALTIEGQLRTLSDLAFMMQDYDLCLSSLRLLSADLRADKDWRHYAAAQVNAQVSLMPQEPCWQDLEQSATAE